MMLLQRACDAESQVRNKLSNGPLRVQSNVKMNEGCQGATGACPETFSQSILQRVGIRQLPGICWYPTECTGLFP